MADLNGKCFPYKATLSPTCAASSRVGVKMSALTGCFFAGCLRERSSSSGKVKPAVFPVPVCAPAKISFF